MASQQLINIYITYAVLVCGAITGDQLSYHIGRTYGTTLITQYSIISDQQKKKAEQFFKRHGPKAVFFSKFMGPVSRIVPFLAGSHSLNHRTFTLYNIIGSICGIGQFILIGYYGFRYVKIPPRIFISFMGCAIIYSTYHVRKRCKHNKKETT